MAQEQLLDEIISSLAHELKTSVTVIHGFAFQLANNADTMDSEKVTRIANNLQRSSRNLTCLIGSLLDAREVTRESLNLTREEVDLVALIHEAADDMAVVSKIPILTQAPRQLMMFVDPVRIRQVMTNLLVNATRFARDRVNITVSCDREVIVTVQDNGIGVGLGQEGHLYEKFDPSSRGTGLGLFISQGLAKAHGGRIYYEKLESGCCFNLCLPSP